MKKQERRKRFMLLYGLDATVILQEDIWLRFEWEVREMLPDPYESEHERRRWQHIELVHGWRKFPQR